MMHPSLVDLMKVNGLVLSALLGGLAVPATGHEPSREWYHSYETGREAARQQGLPLLLHFYADWCGPCRRMEQGVLNSADVLEQLGAHVVAVKVNVDDEPDLADRFDVSSYPADVLLSPDGEVLMTHKGYASTAKYVELIRSPVAAHHEVHTVFVSAPSPELTGEPGLNGFSPVSITRDRAWRRGDSRHRSSYGGVVYHLADADELRVFQAEPDRYVPRLDGDDPLMLATANRRVPGDIRYAAFYRGGLYLHSSRENRRRFLESPSQYTDRAEKVITEPGLRSSP